MGFLKLCLWNSIKKCGLVPPASRSEFDERLADFHKTLCIMNRIYGHTIQFFIEFHKNNFEKPMSHLSLCLLESTPCFMPTNPTQINDPSKSVDMVLPEYGLNE